MRLQEHKHQHRHDEASKQHHAPVTLTLEEGDPARSWDAGQPPGQEGVAGHVETSGTKRQQGTEEVKPHAVGHL